LYIVGKASHEGKKNGQQTGCENGPTIVIFKSGLLMPGTNPKMAISSAIKKKSKPASREMGQSGQFQEEL